MLLTRDWRTTTIAIVAAYAIVVQALLLATSGAFHAASSSTDPLGIICTEDGSIPAPPDTPARHSHDSPCCIVGCAFAAKVAGTTPETGPTFVSSCPSRWAMRAIGARAPPRSI